MGIFPLGMTYRLTDHKKKLSRRKFDHKWVFSALPSDKGLKGNSPYPSDKLRYNQAPRTAQAIICGPVIAYLPTATNR